jgi:hypothetical protein
MARKSYDDMTQAERRVAIAKEVIANIHASRLNVRSRYGYVVPNSDLLPNGLESVAGGTDKAIAEKYKQTCTVCARGAMMLCKVAKFNNYAWNIYGCVDSWDTFEALADAFTEDELWDIEQAFEQVEKNYDHTPWMDIDDDTDRLLAIMQNIVDHKGTFQPDVAYKII